MGSANPVAQKPAITPLPNNNNTLKLLRNGMFLTSFNSMDAHLQGTTGHSPPKRTKSTPAFVMLVTRELFRQYEMPPELADVVIEIFSALLVRPHYCGE